MSLERVLEPVPEDPALEAQAYRGIDHTEVNGRFAHDLLAGGSVGPRVLDLGTGPAHIPILLCEIFDSHGARLREVGEPLASWLDPPWGSECQLEVMATDACVEMLELARFEIEFSSMVERVHLAQIDLTEPEAFQSEIADTVISNSVAHHLADPSLLIRQAMHALKPGGRLFIRDLMRPESESQLEEIVATVAAVETNEPSGSEASNADEALIHQQLLRQSLHAALTLAEIRAICRGFEIAGDCVVATSERHWTIDCTCLG